MSVGPFENEAVGLVVDCGLLEIAVIYGMLLPCKGLAPTLRGHSYRDQ